MDLLNERSAEREDKGEVRREGEVLVTLSFKIESNTIYAPSTRIHISRQIEDSKYENPVVTLWACCYRKGSAKLLQPKLPKKGVSEQQIYFGPIREPNQERLFYKTQRTHIASIHHRKRLLSYTFHNMKDSSEARKPFLIFLQSGRPIGACLLII
jgi:hypothetical protein